MDHAFLVYEQVQSLNHTIGAVIAVARSLDEAYLLIQKRRGSQAGEFHFDSVGDLHQAYRYPLGAQGVGRPYSLPWWVVELPYGQINQRDILIPNEVIDTWQQR